MVGVFCGGTYVRFRVVTARVGGGRVEGFVAWMLVLDLR